MHFGRFDLLAPLELLGARGRRLTFGESWEPSPPGLEVWGEASQDAEGSRGAAPSHVPLVRQNSYTLLWNLSPEVVIVVSVCVSVSVRSWGDLHQRL